MRRRARRRAPAARASSSARCSTLAPIGRPNATHTPRIEDTSKEGSMQDLVDLVFGTYPSWSHLVVRLALGIVFFAHGAQKTFGWFGGHGLSATIAGFRQMNIPPAATRSEERRVGNEGS